MFRKYVRQMSLPFRVVGQIFKPLKPADLHNNHLYRPFRGRGACLPVDVAASGSKSLPDTAPRENFVHIIGSEIPFPVGVDPQKVQEVVEDIQRSFWGRRGGNVTKGHSFEMKV